jgi:hypothetical protein
VLAVAADLGRQPEVLAALHGARVFAAVAAVADETATTAAGLTVDKTADIALVVLQDPDGRRALPVFSSLAALSAWDPAARPVPVEGPRAAGVALAEGASDLLLDPAGPHAVTLGEREVRALLRPAPTSPAYVDEELAATIRAVTSHVPAVRTVRLDPWPGVDARLTLVLGAGADPAAAAQEVAARLALLAPSLVRGLDLAVEVAGAAEGP